MTYKHLNSLNSFFGDRKDTAAAAAGQTFQTFIVFAEWKVLLLDWGELVLDSRRAQDSESVSNSSAAALRKQCDDFSVSADCAGTTVICHTSKISMYYTWWIQMCNVAPTKDGFCENDWSTSSQWVEGSSVDPSVLQFIVTSRIQSTNTSNTLNYSIAGYVVLLCSVACRRFLREILHSLMH